MSEDNEVAGVVLRCSPGLTGGQRRHLRALGHHLKPVVMVGDRGLHDAVLAQIDRALLDHELIKVKLLGGDTQEREQAAELIHARTGAQVVQMLGRVVLLYARHPEKPRIDLPSGGKK